MILYTNFEYLEIKFPDKPKSNIAQKNVSIDLGQSMDLRVTQRPKSITEKMEVKREKSLSFRLPTAAGNTSATLVEDPDEEVEEQQTVSYFLYLLYHGLYHYHSFKGIYPSGYQV